MPIAVLDTGLFPDRETLRGAVAALAAGHDVVALDAASVDDDAGWDALLEALLASERTLTL